MLNELKDRLQKRYDYVLHSIPGVTLNGIEKEEELLKLMETKHCTEAKTDLLCQYAYYVKVKAQLDLIEKILE